MMKHQALQTIVAQKNVHNTVSEKRETDFKTVCALQPQFCLKEKKCMYVYILKD